MFVRIGPSASSPFDDSRKAVLTAKASHSGLHRMNGHQRASQRADSSTREKTADCPDKRLRALRFRRCPSIYIRLSVSVCISWFSWTPGAFPGSGQTANKLRIDDRERHFGHVDGLRGVSGNRADLA